MKKSHVYSTFAAGIAAAILSASPVIAQTAVSTTTTSGGATTTSTTTSAGTISEFSPDAFVIKSETSTTPMHYSYTKRTTYVDENGAPVSMDIVKSGVPVTVYYTRDGDNMVATKVIVRKAVSTGAGDGTVEKKTTTTTTTTDK